MKIDPSGDTTVVEYTHIKQRAGWAGRAGR